MNELQILGLIKGKGSKSIEIFNKICPNIKSYKYKNAEWFVKDLWNKYEEYKKKYMKGKKNKNSLNGSIFELIIMLLLVKEEVFPFYFQAQVNFIPNIDYDVLLYSVDNKNRTLISLSIKTSLRERYKQADLEALALKNVFRHSRNYLITINEAEHAIVKKKIDNKEILALDRIINAFSPEIDDLITELKGLILKESDSISVIKSNKNIINQDKFNLLN